MGGRGGVGMDAVKQGVSHGRRTHLCSVGSPHYRVIQRHDRPDWTGHCGDGWRMAHVEHCTTTGHGGVADVEFVSPRAISYSAEPVATYSEG